MGISFDYYASRHFQSMLLQRKRQIEQFIKRRFEKDCNWLTGNCYWFAHILIHRFQQLQIYYEPISGHFVAGYNNIFFDASGMVSLISQPTLFSQLAEEDPTWYRRLVRDCII